MFGAVCGSAVATTGLMSRVAIPEMQKNEYKDELTAGTIGSGASLSTLIPPSLPLITYGASIQCSIGRKRTPKDVGPPQARPVKTIKASGTK